MIKNRHNLSIVNYALVYHVERFGFKFKCIYHPAHMDALIDFYRRKEDIVDPITAEYITDGTESHYHGERPYVDVQIFKWQRMTYYVWDGGNPFCSIEELTEHLREYFS